MAVLAMKGVYGDSVLRAKLTTVDESIAITLKTPGGDFERNGDITSIEGIARQNHFETTEQESSPKPRMAALTVCFRAPRPRGLNLSKDCNVPTALSVLRVISIVVGSLCLVPVAFGSSAQLAGHWEGTMIRQDARLEVSFDFTTVGEQTKGTFTSLTQRVMDYPVTDLTTDGDRVHFTVADWLVFDGKVSANEIVARHNSVGPLAYVDALIKSHPVSVSEESVIGNVASTEFFSDH
jgi:hypothetical protein